MAFIQWPPSLPTKHIVGSWSREPDRGPDMTQFEDGPDLQRAPNQIVAYAEPVTIPMTTAQRELFWHFWEVTLVKGSMMFEAPVYAPGISPAPVRRVLIVGKPRETESALDRFLITVMRKVYG
jgi:hypothetical protein